MSVPNKDSVELRGQFQSLYNPSIADLELEEFHDRERPVVYLEQAIELAAAQVAEARIDELRSCQGYGERGGHDVYCRTIGQAVLDRIAAKS